MTIVYTASIWFNNKEGFFLCHNVQTNSWAHSAPYSIVPGPISCDKWQEYEADPPSLASSNVKNVWSYFCRPRCLFCCVQHILTSFHNSLFPPCIHCSFFVVPSEMMDRGFTVLCSQQPITSPYPEPDETWPHPFTTSMIGRLCYDWITCQNKSIMRHTTSNRVTMQRCDSFWSLVNVNEAEHTMVTNRLPSAIMCSRTSGWHQS